ncbi:MAG: FadR/GntR family transcriptional regulator [Albidovulum sp.]|nr:FadR/GntR family transcriptional regulator [Albidovulum sp.]
MIKNGPLPVRRERLADQVVNRLRNWLASDFSPGDRLPPEPQLMGHFQVGRSTIREAVGVLAYAGILSVRAGDGTYFQGFNEPQDSLAELFNQEQIAEVFEIRRAFEMAIAGLAAEKRTEDELSKIEEAVFKGKDCIESRDLAGFLKADFEFHTALVCATHNNVLIKVYRDFRESWLENMSGFVERVDFRENLIELHEKLYNAIKRGSATEAQEIWLKTTNPFK